MQFENICPFVRYAVKTTYLPNRYMVKAQDCRLFYTITGSGTFVTPDSSYPLKPGSLVLYPAGHAYMPLPEKEDKLLFFIINFDYNTHYARYENVMPPCNASAFAESNVLPSHLDTGIDRLNRFLYMNDADYLHEHYAEPLTNESLAKAFGYHPYHLGRLFKTFTGQTLHAYLLELRLEKALECLLNDTLPIGEVAARNGFVSAEHFSTAFHKKYGQPPSRFCAHIH